MRPVDVTGQRFDKLVALDWTVKRLNGISTRLWRCRCDCGGERLVTAGELRVRGNAGIGCVACKTARKSKAKTHGGTHQRLYATWHSMRQRCSNKNCRLYRWYGAKGVRVCDEWQTYEGFRMWALQNGYASNLTIDRVNVAGNYEPTNCQWVTYAVNRWRQSNPDWKVQIPVMCE